VRAQGPASDAVIPRQRTGRVQAEHLAATGHRLLGCAYPDDPRVKGFADPRLEGARTACAELGLDAPAVRPVPMDADAAAAAVKGWVAEGVTGVCAYNDDVAVAVLAGTRLAGVAVPLRGGPGRTPSTSSDANRRDVRPRRRGGA
jgi:DNA-binding LacI/PurR family transcriptional regulator